MTDFTLAERYLTDFAVELNDRVFRPAGHRLDDVLKELRFRVGTVPGSKGTSQKTLGLYVDSKVIADRRPQIYVTPLVSDPKVVGHIIAHELVHALRPDAGHSPKGFGVVARAVGLEGPLRSTHAGPELAAVIDSIVDDLGKYPHGAINLVSRKKQGIRQRKFVCPLGCDVIGRFTRKHASRAAHLCEVSGEFGILVEDEGEEDA